MTINKKRFFYFFILYSIIIMEQQVESKKDVEEIEVKKESSSENELPKENQVKVKKVLTPAQREHLKKMTEIRLEKQKKLKEDLEKAKQELERKESVTTKETTPISSKVVELTFEEKKKLEGKAIGVEEEEKSKRRKIKEDVFHNLLSDIRFIKDQLLRKQTRPLPPINEDDELPSRTLPPSTTYYHRYNTEKENEKQTPKEKYKNMYNLTMKQIKS